MIIVIQRVNFAKCIIKDKVYSEIKKGLLALVSIEKDDNLNDYEFCIKKLLNLRVFENDENKFDKSIQDINGEIMVISQFTLAGNINKGNRPSFDNAMPPQAAKIEFEKFLALLNNHFTSFKTGIFGEYMQIQIENNGPVTFIIDSKKRLYN
ncbi:MAG: D-aminoacyl-tRNA deacylase [Spirochaetes bacterium]|nr:D-aminoacyl-tRNA deacylase [Spirochaetota bacterium]